MQRLVFRVLLVVSVCFVLSGLAANAQALKKLTIQVPFDFNVRAHHYPAGTYSVLREGAFLSLVNNKGRVLEVLMANHLESERSPDQSKLVFFDYHGTHFLTRILWQGEGKAFALLPAGHEEEIARKFAPEAVTSAQAGGRP